MVICWQNQGKCERTGIWKCERVKVWECERVKVWKFKRVNVWKRERTEIWKCERVKVWKVKVWNCEKLKVWKCKSMIGKRWASFQSFLLSVTKVYSVNWVYCYRSYVTWLVSFFSLFSLGTKWQNITASRRSFGHSVILLALAFLYFHGPCWFCVV